MKLVFKQDNKEIIQEGNHFFVRVTEDNGEVTESQDYNTIDRAKASIGILSAIEENNKLIAEFLGYETYEMNGVLNVEYSENNIRTIQDTHYHIDWNWLMEVVEKILNICLELDSMEMYYNITDSIPKIDKAYNDCVEFIKWYNENK
jgi:hypothetical protein